MKKYTIFKGLHYSNHWIKLILFPKRMEFDFILTDKSAYRPSKYRDEASIRQLKHQVNKIGGMTLDFIGKNSVRLGYRYNWEKDTFEVLPYYHIDGKRVWNDEQAQVIEKGVRYTCRIGFCFKMGSSRMISLKVYKSSNYSKLIISDKKWFAIEKTYIGFRQYPYFGGRGRGSKAPNNIQILIDFK